MKKKSKAGLAGKAKRFAAAALAGCMLYCGGMQANAATLKDVFDEHYYADMYPDLKEVYGYNREALWQHFMRYGVNEGRNMNGLIDIVKYREMYSDLDAAFGDNWNAYLNHYLTFGAKENRETGTDFDALDYAGRYEDLQEKYGTNVLALWNHYRTIGATEGREARDESIVQAEIEAELAAEAEEAAEKESSGGRTEREDWHGGYWIRVYDNNNNLIKVESHYKDGTCYAWTIFEYDSNGKLVKEVSYDKDGNCTGWTVRGDNKSIWYKADGTVDYYVIRTNYASGNSKTETVYNADDSVRRIREYYDASGKILSKDTYYNEDGSYYVYENNSAGKMVKYTNYNKDNVIDRMSTNEYDSIGNVVKQTSYAYEDGKVTSIYERNSDGSYKSTHYHYNEDGSYSVSMSDSNGNSTTTYYNADGTVKE